MAADQLLELGDDLGVPAERQVRVDPLLERVQPLLLEPRDLGAREPVARHVGERRSAPQPERVAQRRRRRVVVTRRARTARRLHQLGEPMHVELALGDVQDIALAARLDARLDVAADRPPQARHVGLHGLDRGGRRVVGPELVDEVVHRDDLLGAEQQQRQHRALRANAQIDRPLAVEDLKGTKDAEVHCSPTLAEPQPDRNRGGLDRTRQPSAKETHMRKFPQPRFDRVG